MRKIASLALVCFLLSPLSAVSAGQNEWLLGNWVHAYGPVGDMQDTLTFAEEGVFITTESTSGKTIEGVYYVKSDFVQVYMIVQGKISLKLKLAYDSRKDRLYYHSEETGQTSYYTKQE
jgi:hypothetical protein